MTRAKMKQQAVK